VRELFSDILPLGSLIPLDFPSRDEEKRIEAYGVRLWRQFVLVGVGMLGLVGWTVVFGMSLVAATQGAEGVTDILAAAGMMLVWVGISSSHLNQYSRTRSTCSSSPSSIPPQHRLGQLHSYIYSCGCPQSVPFHLLASFERPMATSRRGPDRSGSRSRS
jgi:hypothetical protein